MRRRRDSDGHWSVISAELYQQWLRITLSRDGTLEYRPCQAVLQGGMLLDCVYVMRAQEYFPHWGVWPDQDLGKKQISIQDVVRIEESPSRLPPEIASRIYAAGESGMGYCVFTLSFSDVSRQAYVTGNAVDFVPMPPGKTPAGIADVFPHEGRTDSNQMQGLGYYWCLFGGVEGEE